MSHRSGLLCKHFITQFNVDTSPYVPNAQDSGQTGKDTFATNVFTNTLNVQVQGVVTTHHSHVSGLGIVKANPQFFCNLGNFTLFLIQEKNTFL